MIVRWVLVVIGLCLSVGFAYVNLRIMVLPFKDNTEGHHSSCVPFAGGIIGALSLLLCPIRDAAYWFWVPFLIDPGSGYFSFLGIKESLQSRKSDNTPQSQHEDDMLK